MRPAQLLAHFDRISEAPDAVPRLRGFILDLAVRGKLVEQDPHDEPASELLKRIQAKKARHITNGGSKRSRQSPPGVAEELRLAVPQGWALTTLEELTYKITDGAHRTPTYIDKGVPFVSVKDFSGGVLDFSCTRFISPEEHALLYKRCDPRRGDILIGRIGTLGKAVLVDTDKEFSLFVSVGLIRFGHECIDPNFFRSLLNSPYAENQFNRIKVGGGTHTNKLNLADLRDIVLPLPPLSEQGRIVAKVDELMALCNRLEAAQAERESRRDRLVAASLHRLNEPADPPDFREHAQFHLRHLPRLATRPEHVQQLRQTILNLAVRGKLARTASWPRQPEPLRKFASLQNGYAFKSEWFVRSGVRLLRNTNVSHGVIRWDDTACLPEDHAAEFERFRLVEGDIVLSLDRPFIVTGTKVARVRAEDLPCLLLQRVGRFQPKQGLLTPDYLFLWLHSPHFTDQIDPGRSNGVPHISSKQVEAAAILVPPLAEQHRIVAKVGELMALCDRLEAQLATAQSESRRLLEAVLHEALK
jgi:type I restriction enzyme S subunit